MNSSVNFHLTLFEKLLIFAGVLFLVNVIYIATGGDFSILFVAKAVYFIGIVILAINLYKEN